MLKLCITYLKRSVQKLMSNIRYIIKSLKRILTINLTSSSGYLLPAEELHVKSASSFLNETKRTELVKLKMHKRRAKKCNNIQKQDKLCQDDDSALGICFNYMQNILFASIPVQDTFYLQQLSVFPFSIHNLKDNTA